MTASLRITVLRLARQVSFVVRPQSARCRRTSHRPRNALAAGIISGGPMIRPSSDTTSTNEILLLERAALDRWGKGDPGGFLDLYAADISYFDPVTAKRIDGHQAMADYYRPWFGKIRVARFEMLNPQVVIDGSLALLTYNLEN